MIELTTIHLGIAGASFTPANLEQALKCLPLEAEHHQTATHIGVMLQFLESTYGTQTSARVCQVKYQTNTRPTADTIHTGNMLLAFEGVGHRRTDTT